MAPRLLRSLRFLLPRRSFAVGSVPTRYYSRSSNPAFDVFNRDVKRTQKDRAASDIEMSRDVDYLRNEVASRLSDRLLDIRRNFPTVLDFGSNSCNVANALTQPPPRDPDNPSAPIYPPPATRISELVCVDESRSLLYRDADLSFNSQISITRQVLPDLEQLPYEANTFDAILSCLSMHWINDLPSVLCQINNMLKPDCPFIGVMFGGDTLFELRTSLLLADQERRGGVTPHVSPLADTKDVGSLLQRAGFKLLTVDMEDIIVGYPDIISLMTDLQAMGENNAVIKREKGPISRDVLLSAGAIYRALHGEEGKEGIPATFRLIWMIGWKEGPGQAKPMQRGSGEFDLREVLGEEKVGDNEDQKRNQ